MLLLLTASEVRFARAAGLGLLVATGALGCACTGSPGSEAGSDTADVPATDASDGPFVDVAPRDGALPCGDQQVALLPVGLTGGLTAGPGSSAPLAAGNPDGLVLAWEEHDGSGSGTWRSGRVHDLASPVAEPLAEALPLPGILGLFSAGDAVRFLFSEAPRPRDPFTRGGWADLGRDGSFGSLTPFEVRADGVVQVNGAAACSWDGDIPAAAVSVCDARGWLGVSVLLLADGDTRFLAPVFSAVHLGYCATSSLSLDGCLVHDGEVSLVADPVPNSDAPAVLPPMVVRWTVADGTAVGAPIPLGDTAARNLVTRDALGPVFFRFDVAGAPGISAFRIADDAAVRVAGVPLDPFVGSMPPFPVGALPTSSQLLVLYNHQDVLFLLPFAASGGFGSPALVTDFACRSGMRQAVTLAGGTYLPCTDGNRLYLLATCRAEGP